MRLFYFQVFVVMLVLGLAPSGFAQNALAPEADEQPAVVQPDPSVTLEANVARIILNDEHRDGVDWAAIVTDFHSAPFIREDDPAWVDKDHKLSVGTVSREDYQVLLEALDTVGQMSQMSRSPLNVSFNQEAMETLSDDLRVKVSLSRQHGGELTLHVEPSVTVLNNDHRPARAPAQAMNMKALTDVAVKDNATIVLGGFFKVDEISKTHKFPLLGDLPLVGLVFRSRGRIMQKTETVIFLSMQVPAGTGSAANEEKTDEEDF